MSLKSKFGNGKAKSTSTIGEITRACFDQSGWRCVYEFWVWTAVFIGAIVKIVDLLSLDL